MKVPPQIKAGAAPGGAAVLTSDPGAVLEEMLKLRERVLRSLPDNSPIFVAQAPGRLDVMGALADYTGSLVLSLPVGKQVCAAVQPRGDSTVHLTVFGAETHNGAQPVVLSLEALRMADKAVIDAVAGRELVGGLRDVRLLSALGVLVEAVRQRVLPDLGSGFTVVVGSGLDAHSELADDAAVASAVLAAAALARGVRLDPKVALAICHRVQTDWINVPVGMSDAACTLLGKLNALTQVRCDAMSCGEPIPLPEGIELCGLDCGTAQTDAGQKYLRVRTATFMGRLLIERIVQHDGAQRLPWDGSLSRVSVNDYVERFRDRLPTKFKGADFIDRFGESVDPLTEIEPDFVYKIRSRTEHHIYENVRAVQFAECISRAGRTGREQPLLEAGELMYASHWSYGQRCGLGSVPTDLMVNLLRRQGPAADIYGAKVSGRGLGGVVTVLMRASSSARAALERAREAFQAKTGRCSLAVCGSSPGALVAGASTV